METERKSEYVASWKDYIMAIRTLQFCNDRKVSEQVRENVDNLLSLVDKVADCKVFEEE